MPPAGAAPTRFDRPVAGIVIVLMAIDHTKDFIVAASFDPLDADVTNLPAYLKCVDHPFLCSHVLLPDGGSCLSFRPRKNEVRALSFSC